MQYDAMTYPEGYEKAKKEELNFLPEDDAVRETLMLNFFLSILQF